MKDRNLAEKIQSLSREINNQLNLLERIQNAKWQRAQKDKSCKQDKGWLYSLWNGLLGLNEEPTIRHDTSTTDYFLPRDEVIQAKYIELLDACENFHQKQIDSLKFDLQVITAAEVEYQPTETH